MGACSDLSAAFAVMFQCTINSITCLKQSNQHRANHKFCLIVMFIVQELGVNCIELMPCQEFNELEYYSYNSVLGDYKYTTAEFLLNILSNIC